MTRKLFKQLESARVQKAEKPLAGGLVEGTKIARVKLPAKGHIKRYILTSAQNNTDINQPLWVNLQALAKHYDAEVFVGTFSYNQNAYGQLAVKRGTRKWSGTTMRYDPALTPFIRDSRIEIANGLVWCGEMNIQPTASDPLSGLETYSHRKSAIFPHVKLAMRSIATMKGEAAKLIYTTGTVTLMNYVQKAAGLKAEHHHEYAFLVVEVNHAGNWWVRQVSAANGGRQIQDLDVIVDEGTVTTGNAVEAITYGDLHATISDPSAVATSLRMRDALRPRYQFIHDVLEGVTINHHSAKDPHARFENHVRGLDSLEEELNLTHLMLERYKCPDTQTMVVDSNHDSDWILRWLRENDYRTDPLNAEIFLETQLEVYRAIRRGDRKFHVLSYLLRDLTGVRFLRRDESFTICNKKIECGQHGHLGANGARGNPGSLKKIGRRANTGHTHSAGIYDGLYVAGTTSKLDWSYAKGPSSWTHSHILTYPNGQRTIVTFYADAWRAE
jgi:hypothetical protein